MQSLARLIVLVAVVSTACGAAPFSSESDEAKALEQKYDQSDDRGKRAFLETWLVKRFDQAARWSLSAEERESQDRRFRRVIDRVAGGERLSPSGVAKLLGEATAVEQLAIDQLSLKYRVRVYDRFHTDRAEYDRRMEIWRRMMARWEASERRWEKADVALAWLVQSLDRMRYDERAQLPPLPEFDGRPPVQVVRSTPPAPAVLPAPMLKPDRRDPLRSPQSLAKPTHQSLPRLPSPAIVRNQPAHGPARIAHRVERMSLPEIAAPPRATVSEIKPIIVPPSNPAIVPAGGEATVQIDFHELTSRVAGYNSALKTMMSELQGDGAWTPDRLAGTLSELRELADRQSQLRLYLNLVSQTERQATGELTPLDAPIALLGAKLFAARESIAPTDADGDDRLRQLDVLSRQLAELAADRGR